MSLVNVNNKNVKLYSCARSFTEPGEQVILRDST